MEEIQKLCISLLAGSQKSNKSFLRYDPHHYVVLRNQLPPRQNRLATMNSLCSLRLPSFFLSPLAHKARGGPDWDSRLNLN